MVIKVTERVHSNFKRVSSLQTLQTIVKLNSENPDGKKQLKGEQKPEFQKNATSLKTPIGLKGS